MKPLIFLIILLFAIFDANAQLMQSYDAMTNKYGEGTDLKSGSRISVLLWNVSDVLIEADFLDNVCVKITYSKKSKAFLDAEINNAIVANSINVNWETKTNPVSSVVSYTGKGLTKTRNSIFDDENICVHKYFSNYCTFENIGLEKELKDLIKKNLEEEEVKKTKNVW